MSYVPPHLRNSSAGKTTTLNSNGADQFSSKLSSHQSTIHCNGELDKFSSNGYSSSSRRSSVNYSTASRTAIPAPEFPQWKPSERVLRLKSEQVRIFSSTRKWCYLGYQYLNCPFLFSVKVLHLLCVLRVYESLLNLNLYSLKVSLLLQNCMFNFVRGALN